MKQLLKKISAIIMAFVVLLSTMSFTVSEHYCGGNLVASAIFSKIAVCGMDMQKKVPLKDSYDNDNNCCKDVVKHFECQNELNTNFSTLNFEQQQFVASFVYSYINLFEGFNKNTIPSNNYSPPMADKDINVLYRVFRI